MLTAKRGLRDSDKYTMEEDNIKLQGWNTRKGDILFLLVFPELKERASVLLWKH